VLPELAAALDAWPQALPPADDDGTARLWDAAADTSGRSHSDCSVAVVHAALQGLCAAAPTLNVHHGSREDLDSPETEQLAALCLRHWGRLQWDWRDDVSDEALAAGTAQQLAHRNRISLGEVFAVLGSLRQ
jgi:hypothetical protein